MDAISLSPVALFETAGPIGRGVTILLGLASVWSWILIVEATVTLLRLGRSAVAPFAHPVFAEIVAAGAEAAALTIPAESVGERRHRLTEAMNRALRGILARAEGRLSDLAVVASVAPFVGLFGTVWGIMTSFAGIAAAHDTSLAVVAPGIAEALAATAWGLAAAIPASVGWSRLGAGFARLGAGLADRVEERAVDLVAGREAP